MEDVKTLRKLVKFAKNNGIRHLKCDGFEFEVAPQHIKAPRIMKRATEADAEQLAPTKNADFLLWSVPDMPDAMHQ